jgi:hypothetical protein
MAWHMRVRSCDLRRDGRVDSAPVAGRRDARDERGVVGEPSVHVSYALDSEPAAGQGRLQRGQLITPDRDKDDVVHAAGIRHDVGFGVGSPSAEHIAGVKASIGHLIGPRPVAQHRDRAACRREVRP